MRSSIKSSLWKELINRDPDSKKTLLTSCLARYSRHSLISSKLFLDETLTSITLDLYFLDDLVLEVKIYINLLLSLKILLFIGISRLRSIQQIWLFNYF